MIWKPVPGFEDAYLISDNGDIKNIKRRKGTFQGRFKSHVISSEGYHKVGLCDGIKCKKFLVHRLVLLTFLGPPTNVDMHAAHIDGNKDNNNIQNLYWATPQQNSDDKQRHGAMARGERIACGKLTANSVVEIRKIKSTSTITNNQLGKMFGVSGKTISRIINYLDWRHVA